MHGILQRGEWLPSRVQTSTAQPVTPSTPTPTTPHTAATPRQAPGAAAQAASSLVWGLGVLMCLLIVGVIVAIALRRSALSFSSSVSRPTKPKGKLRSAWDVSADRMPLETSGPREDPDQDIDRSPRN